MRYIHLKLDDDTHYKAKVHVAGIKSNLREWIAGLVKDALKKAATKAGV